MRRLKFLPISIAVAASLLFAFPSSGALASPIRATSPVLGAARNFSVLAGSTVTNTVTATTANRGVGVSPGTAITNFPPGIAGGGTHSNDGPAINAQARNLVLFGAIDQPCDFNFGAQDLTLISPLIPGRTAPAAVSR